NAVRCVSRRTSRSLLYESDMVSAFVGWYEMSTLAFSSVPGPGSCKARHTTGRGLTLHWPAASACRAAIADGLARENFGSVPKSKSNEPDPRPRKRLIEYFFVGLVPANR